MKVAAYPTYDRCKDSGIDWVGQIPAHWDEKRLKHLGVLYAGLAGKAGDDFSKEQREGFLPFVPFVSVANFSSVPPQFDYVRAKEDERQSRVRKGDILFLMSSETEEDIARSALFDLDGIEPFLNSFCKGFRCDPSRIMPAFTNYLLMAKAYRDYFSTSARGFTRINLKQEYILNARILLPPLPEQRAIAAFLDEKCAKIDDAVRIKEAQIGLLRERRQILIQDAVTRGLNPDAPMKDSGIDWIGQIPAHWEVLPLKRLFRERNDRSTTGTETLLSLRMNEGLVPHDDVSDKAIDADALKDYKQVFPRQLVMNRMRASIGIFGVVTASGIVSPDYAIFDIAPRANADFFLQLFKTGVMGQQFRNASRGLGTGSSGFMRLYTDNFGAISVALPPAAEQSEIVFHINDLLENIGDAVRLKEEQIIMLKEYKTCLINAAVTGKIKVT